MLFINLLFEKLNGFEKKLVQLFNLLKSKFVSLRYWLKSCKERTIKTPPPTRNINS